MTNVIDISQLISKIHNSLSLLRLTFTSMDGQGGWYHYLDSEKPGPTASAVGLMSFRLAKEHFEHTDEVLAFLKSRQVNSSDPKKNGGWAISMMPDQPSLESSGWVTQCLGELRPYMLTETPDIFSAYMFLVNNKNDDNGWGSFYGQPSRTYLTCMALRAIAAVDPLSKVLSDGQKWLALNKNRTLPAWGATISSPPTIMHTAYVLLTLSELDIEIDRGLINDALKWLTDMVNPMILTETQSLVEDYDIFYEKNGSVTVYQNSLPHYALPVAISALLRYKNALDNDVVYRGLLTIANSQHENGYWENARNPTRISIWAIWPFLQALFDAVNLPVLSSAETVTKIADAILVRTGAAKTPVIILVMVDFLHLAAGFLKAYWSPLLLVIFIVAGLILTTISIIGVSEYILSLLVPIILVFVQLAFERRKDKKLG